MRKALAVVFTSLVISSALLLAGCEDYSKYDSLFVESWISQEATIWSDADDPSTATMAGKLYRVDFKSNNTWTIRQGKEDAPVLYEGTWQVTGDHQDKLTNGNGTYVESSLYLNGSEEKAGTARYYPNNTVSNTIASFYGRYEVNLLLDDGSKLHLQGDTEENIQQYREAHRPPSVFK